MNEQDCLNALLVALLKKAVQKCYDNDYCLIERCMEQASVARIFYYMQDAINKDKRFSEFRKLNLDSEFNKNGEEIKCTQRRPNGTRPDIVLHQRGNNSSNMLVVEFKSHCNNRHESDYIKLEDFTCPCVYNYSLGVFVRLRKGTPEYVCFKSGKVVPKEEGRYE